jgi:hypothetical protein
MQAMLMETQRHWNFKMMRRYQMEERELIRHKKSAEYPILKAAISCVARVLMIVLEQGITCKKQ